MTPTLRVLTLAAVVSLAGCAPTPPAAPAAPAPEPVAAPAPVVPVPDFAVVDFVDGEAQANDGSGWVDLDIGSKVTGGSTVKTGKASAAELKVGDLATVRLGAETVLKWEALTLTAGARKSQIQVTAGQVLNKVAKLVGNDAYLVRTPTAALGVRGTQFSVQVGPATALAVKDGTVAVLPPSYDPAGWAQANPDKASDIATLAQTLLTASDGVSAGRKTEIPAGALAGRDAVLAPLARAWTADPPSLESSFKAAPAATPPQRPLTAADQKALAPLDTMQLQGEAPTPVSAVTPAAPVAPAQAPPKPATRMLPVTPGTPVAAAAALPGGLVVSDGQGTLKAVKLDGSALWTASVASGSNPAVAPVVDGSDVVWTGDSQVEVFDAATGKKTLTITLDAKTSGVFGKRAWPLGSSLYLSSSSGVAVFDRSTGALQTTLPLAEGSDMSVAVAANRIVFAGRAGTLVGFAPGSTKPAFQVETAAVQPVAAAPALAGDLVAFGDRKGLVTGVSIGGASVVWTSNVGSGVFDQPLVSGDVVFVYAKSTLHALSATDGTDAWPAVTGLTAAPITARGLVLFGQAAVKVRTLDARTGAERWSGQAPSPVSAQPVVVGSEVVFPLEDGTAYVLDLKAVLP